MKKREDVVREDTADHRPYDGDEAAERAIAAYDMTRIGVDMKGYGDETDTVCFVIAAATTRM